MTDRIRHLTVTLDKDYRDDDVESIVNAICQIRGVQLVKTKVVEPGDYIARSAVSSELEHKLYETIGNFFHPEDPKRNR